MDHLTHSALLWLVVGSAVLAVFLWLAMLSSTVGREHDTEIDGVLSSHPASTEDTVTSVRSIAAASAPERFRLLGDPEYGLFLGDADVPTPVSAA